MRVFITPWIISACAEQTPRLPERRSPTRDHLRVCGADTVGFIVRDKKKGSSPRVRSRHLHALMQGVGDGIISACAEQTATAKNRPDSNEDHLRVCGADHHLASACLAAPGSSPRVRSRRRRRTGRRRRRRIISACAEQTTLLAPYQLM